MAKKPSYKELEKKVKALEKEIKNQKHSNLVTPTSGSALDPEKLDNIIPENIHILVVDDEEMIRQVLEQGIQRAGYHCRVAENGKTALNILEENPIDLVITDINMPEMDGIELTQVIKEKYTSDVIIITGYFEDFKYEEVIEVGASDFLEKPIRLKELIVRIKRVLREREALIQQKQIADILRGNERIFRKTFEAIPVPAFLWEKKSNGRILLSQFNRASYEETEGKIADLIGCELEDYHNHQPEIISQIKYTLDTGEPWHEERMYHNRSSGEEYWLDINYTSPFENCALVVSSNITEQKEAEKELRRLSYLDSLSGVANRRYFDEIIYREWKRAARNAKPLSLIIADIDFFKAYNDTYGHPEGDNCLKKVANTLKASLKRPADMIARYGGEEFAIVLPDTNLKDAAIIAETQRAYIEALEIGHPNSNVRPVITISLGVATSIPEQNSSPNGLISAADQALYKAKNSGRNRVHIAD